jgi:hypothetical protein
MFVSFGLVGFDEIFTMRQFEAEGDQLTNQLGASKNS